MGRRSTAPLQGRGVTAGAFAEFAGEQRCGLGMVESKPRPRGEGGYRVMLTVEGRCGLAHAAYFVPDFGAVGFF